MARRHSPSAARDHDGSDDGQLTDHEKDVKEVRPEPETVDHRPDERGAEPRAAVVPAQHRPPGSASEKEPEAVAACIGGMEGEERRELRQRHREECRPCTPEARDDEVEQDQPELDLDE